ncbi:hypothetical protein AAFJ72_06410 [Brevibacillus gelatini]|uniref:Uncharacterized protein n=1 Tax=Brevibacillus gelatini TaxID=1655277 RepID=A0A3M8B0I0_9BACL|nr:hypothetical protein [Brevibacillus gelatini]RNB56938.1 hypothetical protein EDM57_11505 [Brevibacillus gelatini]
MQELPTSMKVLEWAFAIFLILSLIGFTAFFPILALICMLVYIAAKTFLTWNQNRKKAYALLGFTVIVAILFVHSIWQLVTS